MRGCGKMRLDNRTVCVLIVTYNRKELLNNLLTQLLEQSYHISGIVIVDNNSKDGTSDLLLNEQIIRSVSIDNTVRNEWNGVSVFYHKNSVNTGGSGGFAQAFSIARDLTYDCVWAMDDDVSPDKECLEKLMHYLDETSKVCIPCRGDGRFRDRAIQRYDLKNPFYFHINECKRDTVYFDCITSPYLYVEDMAFEGPLMYKSIIDEVGIPNQDYFILYDDTDYAHRLCSVTRIRYVVDAKLKKMIIPEEQSSWKWKSYYNLRNSVYFEKKYGQNIFVKYLRPFLRTVDLILKAIYKGRSYRVKWLMRAYKDGLCEHMGKIYDPSEIPQS